MRKSSAIQEAPPKADASSRWLWGMVAGGVAVTLLGLLFTRLNRPDEPVGEEALTATDTALRDSGTIKRADSGRFSPAVELPLLPEEIVANKVALFVQRRSHLVRQMAEHFKVSVPEKYEVFFKLAASGDFEQLQALFKELETGHRSEDEWPLWQAVKETFHVVEQTQKWPAHQLLAYGEAVLNSLRPDMVYLGGTDAGRFIPTLLNETSDGGQHIILTQNAFADQSYLRYVNFLYGERLNGLTSEDSQGAFQAYIADAQRRLQHDQQSPDQPKQIRRGENIRVIEDRVQVSGQVAVMAINEQLLTTLMQKNPEFSFAMEESFLLPSTYVNAAPLGPIMELNSQATLTSGDAARSLDFWYATAQQLLRDPGFSDASDVRAAWSQMATAQGNLFANRNLPGEAEQAHRIAAELAPTQPEPAIQLAELLARTGHTREAIQILDSFATQYPHHSSRIQEEKQFLATRRNP
ncbi:MAG: hypothetical protein KIS67_17810 [Verrucomicrobiae bacterium]|nr:hypothetical protein [Verrucomicrobiae bacterium]